MFDNKSSARTRLDIRFSANELKEIQETARGLRITPEQLLSEVIFQFTERRIQLHNTKASVAVSKIVLPLVNQLIIRQTLHRIRKKPPEATRAAIQERYEHISIKERIQNIQTCMEDNNSLQAKRDRIA